jgi:hypothetical protein
MTLTPSCIPQMLDRDFISESSFFQPIGIKQGLGCHALWQRYGNAVSVSCVNSITIEPSFLNGIITFYDKKDFLNIISFLKSLVITHGRENIISCRCIICAKRFEILTIYSMYRFCSEECYCDYRKLPTTKQQELSNC